MKQYSDFVRKMLSGSIRELSLILMETTKETNPHYEEIEKLKGKLVKWRKELNES